MESSSSRHAKSASRSWLKNWLPAIAWMILIFWGSTDLLSSERTSRLIGPVLRWLKPDVTDQTIKTVQMIARKSAHVIEYAILALLLSRALGARRVAEGRSADIPVREGKKANENHPSPTPLSTSTTPITRRNDPQPSPHPQPPTDFNSTQPNPNPTIRYWPELFWALLFCVIYAATDEAHQTLLSSRFGTGWDVLIDTAGAALGLAIVCAWRRLSMKTPEPFCSLKINH